ncbi:MAG: hypothetical protein FWB91_07350 [Defluviitaleaceae bacterium]|nr:hypothetical protein [Defluviitaleaceae bacterium]
MSELRKLRCQRCKEFFTIDIGLPPECCPKCAKEREEQISQLRQLLWEKRGLNAMSLHSMTGLPIEVITNIIDEGDLEEWKVARLLEKNEKGTGYHFKKE